MPKFKLGQCSVDLGIEPLTGVLAAADHDLAWRTYLALVTRPELRQKQLPIKELQDLLSGWRQLLEQWPAPAIERPLPGQLGFLLLAVIELILMPCLASARADGWDAAREFLSALARELASVYGFVDPGASPPLDLLAEWQVRS
jgi:hypothetical protein